MAQIKKIRRKEFVRFFKDYIICEHCEGETRGRCYSETEMVVCSKCNSVLLDARLMEEEDNTITILFTPDDDGSK